MMRKFLILMVTVLAMVMSACRTRHVTSRAEAPLADDQQSPFLDLDQYPGQLGLAIDHSLRKHGLNRPWVAVRGPDGSVWLVAERFHSEHRFDRINLHVTQGQRATATITPYQFGPSYWAILGGTLFADLRSEGDLITGEITRKLIGDKNAVR